MKYTYDTFTQLRSSIDVPKEYVADCFFLNSVLRLSLSERSGSCSRGTHLMVRKQLKHSVPQYTCPYLEVHRVAIERLLVELGGYDERTTFQG